MRLHLSSNDYKKNYNLFAFRSNIEDYRLAYFLNKYSKFLFRRMTKDLHCVINNKNIYFSTFEDKDLDYEKSCYLISNKSLYNEIFSTENSIENHDISKRFTANVKFWVQILDKNELKSASKLCYLEIQ